VALNTLLRREKRCKGGGVWLISREKESGQGAPVQCSMNGRKGDAKRMSKWFELVRRGGAVDGGRTLGRR